MGRETMTETNQLAEAYAAAIKVFTENPTEENRLKMIEAQDALVNAGKPKDEP